MTHILYMMMVTDVHADYGYIKKSQETTDISAHKRLQVHQIVYIMYTRLLNCLKNTALSLIGNNLLYQGLQ